MNLDVHEPPPAPTPPAPGHVGKWEMEKALVDASDGVLLDLGHLTGVSPPLTLRIVSY